MVSKAPVLYWVWDYMNDGGLPDWHREAIEASDLYLGNDVRDPIYRAFSQNNIYYFPFDVADDVFPKYQCANKEHDVVFFGSWIGQGNRQEWLREINKTNPITVFSWNYQHWPEEFDARPAVYGLEFNKVVGQSKIILGFSVEPDCWGYWSNRVGKVLLAGGFLLYQYAPGMELFLRDGAEYFSSIDEAREKIDHYLIADLERESRARIGWMIGQDRFSSKQRIKDLTILMERFLKTGGEGWKI
jgi:spore maturation protein CgeB